MVYLSGYGHLDAPIRDEKSSQDRCVDCGAYPAQERYKDQDGVIRCTACAQNSTEE